MASRTVAMARSEQELAYTQASFDLTVEQGREIELGNCLVMGKPTVRKKGKRIVAWECVIDCEPDLFHSEQEGTYLLHAHQDYAPLAQNARLLPGDRATITGLLTHEQQILLAGGQKYTIKHMSLNQINVFFRAPRLLNTPTQTRRGK